MFKEVFPYKIKQWQKDNRHENVWEFEKELKEEKVRQVFSYPCYPKINAYIERFNRTLREEFIDVNEVLIREEEFKNLLIEWLVVRVNYILPFLKVKNSIEKIIWILK